MGLGTICRSDNMNTVPLSDWGDDGGAHTCYKCGGATDARGNGLIRPKECDVCGHMLDRDGNATTYHEHEIVAASFKRLLTIVTDDAIGAYVMLIRIAWPERTYQLIGYELGKMLGRTFTRAAIQQRSKKMCAKYPDLAAYLNPRKDRYAKENT